MPNEEAIVRSMGDSMIIPASITLIPDLDHQATGSISVLSADGVGLSVASVYDFSTSWRILGPLEVDLTTSWNVGESAWHWYRVEGLCGTVNCDNLGMDYDGCSRMTFVTTVSARNLSELCETLSNPIANAPVRSKISSIRKYSRPMLRDQIISDDCNLLQDVEFCHVPECLDYCVEESAPLLELKNLVFPHDQEPYEVVATIPESDQSDLAAQLDIPDELVARASVSASAFGLGYEYNDLATQADMEAPSVSVSACGCTGIGSSMPIGHSLNKSYAFSNFLKSNGISFPNNLNLLYKSFDTSWSSTTHLSLGTYEWVVYFGLSCVDGLWRLSFSARGGSKQTRLVVDIPPEVICAGRRPSSMVEVYFDRISDALSVDRAIQVRTPPRTPRWSASSAVEVFVGGIFVPHVVYYDELGLFNDSPWDYSPFEIDINPISKNPTTLMNLNGIA